MTTATVYQAFHKRFRISQPANLKTGWLRLYLDQGFEKIFIEGKEKGREKYHHYIKGNPLNLLFRPQIRLQILDPNTA